MSSSTFNSDDHRRYVLWLFAVVCWPALAMFMLGIYLEPVSGDLTRVGFYSERAFGWRQPQPVFAKPLYDVGKYERYHDMVVLGDSFALARPRQQWQNHLAAATGWSIAVMEYDKFDWRRLLASPVFLAAPPKLVVFESVERSFPQRIRSRQICAPKAHEQAAPKPPLLRAELLRAPAPPADSNVRKADWGKIKLGFVINYLWKGARRAVTGVDRSGARKIALTRAAPFSSREQNEMLVYKDDILKRDAWREMSLEEMDCRIRQIKEAVEANGVTRFVLLVAADKLTSYADFVADEDLRGLSLLGQLSERLPDVMPRADRALKAAIRAGETDVYLPDDTHWGDAGHRAVADTLLGFLQH